MITQCCIHALYLSGRDAQPAVDLAKTFERRRCNHRVEADGKMKDPGECLADVVGEWRVNSLSLQFSPGVVLTNLHDNQTIF